MDYSLPGYSVHGILWARILEWVSRPSPWDLFDSGLNRLSCLLNSQVGALPLVPPRKPYMYTYIHVCHLFTLVIKQSDDNPIFPCISCMFFLARCPIDVFPVILLPKALVSVILGWCSHVYSMVFPYIVSKHCSVKKVIFSYRTWEDKWDHIKCLTPYLTYMRIQLMLL